MSSSIVWPLFSVPTASADSPEPQQTQQHIEKGLAATYMAADATAPLPATAPHAPEPEESASEPEETPSIPKPCEKHVRKPSQCVLDIIEGCAMSLNLPRSPKLSPGVQAPTEMPEERVLEGEGTSDWMMVVDFMDEYALAAEIKELSVLKEAGTWELVDTPDRVNIVGSKWVFRVKKDAAGNVIRYKARLVAQRFSQVLGVDYFNTFAPVAHLASICAVLTIAAMNDFEIHQIDIKGAYLNGVLTSGKVIYMRQPPGYAVPRTSRTQVCRLQKTLYGLKQLGRRWYQRLVEIMSLIIVLVHVDNCMIVATSQPLIDAFKIETAKHVDIINLSKLHWILSIEILCVCERHAIFLLQHSYLDSILRCYGLQDLKPVSIPMDPNVCPTSAQSPSTMDKFAQMRDMPYHITMGSLMYASLGTCPDITYTVQTVSCFSTKPGITHWDTVKRIFHYLKGTKELWLSYGGQQKDLVGYADADGNMAEDCHAISGYTFLLHGGAISWSAK
ncbi:unnamed protein product [Cyclocybe aegerita]|uniref:Reverse transcriptase Ty1/copia-type domain-containing protein n=1 Tax=Cyclocybe aegerita TaxID=1973307 RepID=A0A8S0W3S1_CYCAE|nr:unnamed protein product [Cyclocybe aegerita]